MLKVDKSLLSDEARSKGVSPLDAGPRNFYLRVIRHQLPIMIVFMVLSLALTFLYLYTTVPTYVATASMVIDARKLQMLNPQTTTRDEVNVDASMVQTEIELLKSDNVSRAVINKLHLTEDPEFVGEPPGLIGALINRVRGLFATQSQSVDDQDLKRARLEKGVLGTFNAIRMVTRVGLSYVMEINVQSVNPEKAAKIANAIAEAYIDDELNSKYEETRRASIWLQDRLKELRSEVAAQQQAVVDFRKQHNIIDSGANGQLMNDQQLSEVNSQLILAQASTAEAKARYGRIQEVMKQDVPDASISDALNNPIIVKLRGEYLSLAARMAIYSQKYGSDHLSVIALRTSMRELQHSIQDEMSKIEQSYKSDYEIALAREQSLRNSLGSAVSQTQVTNQAQVQLRELESAAQTSKTLHDYFLQRYMEGVQQQSFPITEARIVGAADAPLSKSYPKTSLVLLIAMVGGAMLSFGIGALREVFDRVFRSSAQVEEELQVSCLALLPLIKTAAGSSPSVANLKVTETALEHPAPALLMRSQAIFELVLDQPFSGFSEALRAVKVTSDLSGILKAKKVMGILSTLPGEGKSTISANYAQLIAHSGSHAILIDADLRNPTLSRQLGFDGPGLIDVLAGWKSLDEILLLDQRSGLRFLPAGAKSNMPHTNELLASDAMKKLITVLHDNYDYLIVDLPPLIPVIDARASTNFIDAYICVVEWGCTKVDLIRHGLSNAPEIYERLLGVILNKVDMTTIGRYERHRSNYYYEKYRSRYGNLEQSASVPTRSPKERRTNL
jgi:succinoglycan biosynthesis transport protein ExoP